ncbi:hypothetical protein SKAU_G00243500 [Synaphobranchus kaupii]|uniref:Uncharacterized protein n=1 Tax=Synaphobranchus kaupii TaxID=118154 RepID=A0A9Q1F8I7_SYNKA|nr:hypothetical protein SKAU_G00243500 [Synaphobranchus kaupii]
MTVLPQEVRLATTFTTRACIRCLPGKRRSDSLPLRPPSHQGDQAQITRTLLHSPAQPSFSPFPAARPPSLPSLSGFSRPQ